MQTRRIFIRPDEVLEIVLPPHPASNNDPQSVCKLRAFRGASGNAQVLAYSQPFARLHLDLSQSSLQELLRDDPSPTDQWPFRFKTPLLPQD